eukprot:COSAG02_NODE_71195_length_192_cov_20.881720_1_plen_25_part_01
MQRSAVLTLRETDCSMVGGTALAVL